MCNAYAGCQSFEGSGTIKEREIDSVSTNRSVVSYQVQFVRGGPFRAKLQVKNNFGIGRRSLMYYWDGNAWSIYDSAYLYHNMNPVRTNADEAEVFGSGNGASHGLIPLTPALLCLYGRLCGFWSPGSDTSSIDGVRAIKIAEVGQGRFRGNAVYRLNIRYDLERFHNEYIYWIDPQSYMILKDQAHEVVNPPSLPSVMDRDTTHSPLFNVLSGDARIEFDPPIDADRKLANQFHDER